MLKFPLSHKHHTISGLTPEHLKALEGNVEWHKEILQQEYEDKQKRFAEKWTLTKKRAVDLANRRKRENMKVIATNRARHEQYQFQLHKVKNNEFYKRLTLIAFFNHRDKKKVINIAQRKELKLTEKHTNELKRYWTIYDRQKLSIEYNKTLIDECIEHKPKISNFVETNVGKKKEIKEPLEKCPFTQVKLIIIILIIFNNFYVYFI